jgi:HupE / UreJ protein
VGVGGAIEHSEIACTESLTGHEIRIDGLAATTTDALVRIETANGHVQAARLTPSSPGLVVEGVPGALSVLRAYVGLGVEHILFGVDHLLFVLCLLLLVRSVRSLLATITAFTLAHSITLVLATFDIIRVPAAPVEATSR